MNGAGDEFLPRPRLPLNEHRRLPLGYPRRLIEHAQETFGVTNNAREAIPFVERRTERAHLFNQVLPLHGTMHNEHQGFEVDGFGYVI